MPAPSFEGISPEKLFASAPELVCVFDAGGTFLEANDAGRSVLGRDPEALRGTPLASLVADEEVEVVGDLFGSLGEERTTTSRVVKIPVEGRGLRRVRFSVRVDPDDGLRYAVAWDVTEKQHRQARYRAVMEASPTALLMADQDGGVVLANEAAERLLGLDKWSLLGQNVDTFVPRDAWRGHPGHRKAYLQDPAPRPMGGGRDVSLRRGDGTLLSVEIDLNPVVLDGDLYVVVSLVDVTERRNARAREQELADELRRANESLRELAVTDALTGIWNRRKFFEEADRFIRLLQQTGGPFSLIILDLDDFKSINDRFGHLAGDEVLRLVAAELRELRRGSDIVARLGGEEFVVALPGTTMDGAVQLAERLRRSVEGLRWHGRPVTASLGVTALPELGERGVPPEGLVSHLLRAADHALYAAKAAGKNRVIHRAVSRDVLEGLGEE
ncbi:MAG: diguanylate cyclase [Gemmatimonadota bacterium]